ncbi:mCpol domain-containing protein [Photobacterium swingsii]|uniref:mCpol domain-containing protein n=1 Tax=Photobacterium swingsii TaxID=680026 RepID=UPI0040690B33
MKYITIDGDDVGRKITASYLRNDVAGLKQLSFELEAATKKIANLLTRHGFSLIFCAADGVVASSEHEHDFLEIFSQIQEISPNTISFSAGVGSSLKDAYIALLDAKSNGKNRLCNYSNS